MRILHTSDWHLGQHFMGKTRHREHQALLDWLLAQVAAHDVDAVIVAGDIFDTGTPPSYARELYNRFVIAMQHSGAQLVLLGGNHDSVATLNESRDLLACLGTRVIAGVDADAQHQLLLLPQRDGTPGAILCAIPFIRPRDVMQSQAGQSAADKQQTLQDSIHRHYQQLYQLACARRQQLGLPLPIIATGHLTTVGASSSESVREIYVGSLAAFPAHAFPAADYIALGHIHRPQQVGGQPHIRYCGSPLALGFDEAGQEKQVLLVTLDENGLQAVTPLAVPCFQPLRSVRGSLTTLAAAIRDAAGAGSADTPVWLEVVVSSDDYLSDLQGPVQALCAGLPVEVLRIRRERSAAAAALQSLAGETLDELSPQQVFAQRLATETLAPALVTQLQQRYQRVVSELHGDEA